MIGKFDNILHTHRYKVCEEEIVFEEKDLGVVVDSSLSFVIFQKLHYLQLFEQNILAAYIDQLHVGLYMLPFFLIKLHQLN